MNSKIALGAIALFSMMACTQTSAQKISHVASLEFQNQLKTEHNKIILDVRTPEEFEAGHIPGAINLNVNDAGFEAGLAEYDTQSSIFVYCLAGGRSAHAADVLAEKGFKTIINLENGYAKWKAEGFPVEEGQVSATTSKGLSMQEFEKMTQAGDTLVLVDFSAAWCGPCRKIHAFMPEIQKAFLGKLICHELDYDKNSALVTELKLETVPYLKLYKAGKLVWEHKGGLEKDELQTEIQKFL